MLNIREVNEGRNVLDWSMRMVLKIEEEILASFVKVVWLMAGRAVRRRHQPFI
jgi:hypothetical protein